MCQLIDDNKGNSGTNFIVGSLNTVLDMLRQCNLTDAVLKDYVEKANAIIVYTKYSSNKKDFIGKITDLISNINELISTASDIMPEVKDKSHELLITSIDELGK